MFNNHLHSKALQKEILLPVSPSELVFTLRKNINVGIKLEV